MSKVGWVGRKYGYIRDGYHVPEGAWSCQLKGKKAIIQCMREFIKLTSLDVLMRLITNS